ncbi:HHHH-motif protein [Variovorax sp. W6]|uniref:HHHH-motif protein n=1 Tax=Variovorax sp. W6 TaxID=3093895 RepID=UPI003D80811C
MRRLKYEALRCCQCASRRRCVSALSLRKNLMTIKQILLSSIAAFTAFATLSPTLASATPHRTHKVCKWDARHDHRVCHWVR